MTYRKAKCIELYNLGIVIAINGYEYGNISLIGRLDDLIRPTIKIPMVDILRIADALLIDRLNDKNWLDYGWASDQSSEEEIGHKDAQGKFVTDRHAVKAANYEINLNRVLVSADDDWHNGEITELLVDVQGPNLASIKVTSVWDGKSDDPMVEEMTYSGQFTVWWI